jgi:predicted membrane chloride channel (bestrophin family)
MLVKQDQSRKQTNRHAMALESSWMTSLRTQDYKGTRIDEQQQILTVNSRMTGICLKIPQCTRIGKSSMPFSFNGL